MPNSPSLIPINLLPAQWPERNRSHILQRIQERKITMTDLGLIRQWGYGRPHARPNEDWFKQFPNFTLVGHGEFPTSVLTPGMHPKGRKLAFRSKLLQPITK